MNGHGRPQPHIHRPSASIPCPIAQSAGISDGLFAELLARAAKREKNRVAYQVAWISGGTVVTIAVISLIYWFGSTISQVQTTNARLEKTVDRLEDRLNTLFGPPSDWRKP